MKRRDTPNARTSGGDRFEKRAAVRSLTRSLATAFAVALPMGLAQADTGSFGLDHKVGLDQSGIWSNKVQNAVEYGSLLAVFGGALWLGAESQPGHTFWQGVDSTVIGAVTVAIMKPVFSRARPSQTDDPGLWFQGKGHDSFPSGDVMIVTTAVTPFVLEYGPSHPAVYALELLPIYDAVARVKSQAH